MGKNSRRMNKWNYVDLLFAIIHYCFILLFNYYFIFGFVFNVIAIIFPSILLVGVFFTFFARNPFYLYLCLGLLIIVGVIALPLLLFFISIMVGVSLFIFGDFLNIMFLLIFLIPLSLEIWYIINFSTGSGLSSVAKKIFSAKFGAFYGYGGRTIDLFWYGEDLDAQLNERKKAIYHKYNRQRIIEITLACVVGYFAMLIISTYYNISLPPDFKSFW